MNELYVLVDTKINLIISPIMELPSTWGNISGVKHLSEEKLSDLGWAGEKGLGWRRITDPELKTFNVTDDWMGFQRANLKQIISSKRKEMENEIITFEEKQLELNEKTKNSISFKLLGSHNDTDTFSWKFMNGTYEITYAELKEIWCCIDSYIQKCFDIEYEFSKVVDSTEEKGLFNLNLNCNWPSTYLK